LTIRNLKNLTELIPWVPELFRDFAALLPHAENPEGHIWYIGERRVDLAQAIGAFGISRQAERTVLIGDDRDELFAERERLQSACMGFLRDTRSRGWSQGLPHPVQAIAASFCISRLSSEETGVFLKEAYAQLPAGGVFFWIDFFLPQSLSLLAQYQRALAAQLPEVHAIDEDMLNAALHERNLMLPETAVPLLAESGFGNIEICAKRMHLAAIAAHK
jgi:hypothetical protein